MIDRHLAVFYAAAALTAGCGLFFVLTLLAPPEAETGVERLITLTKTGARREEEQQRPKIVEAFRSMAAWLGAHAAARVGIRSSASLQQRFQEAGLPASAVDVYHSARILGPVLGLVVGSLLPAARVFWMAALPAIAYLVPDLILGQLIRRRRDCIRRSVPDVVDLLGICVDAGLGLDQAMLRVGDELSLSYPEMHVEILQINREQRAGRPRLEAWMAMADRVKLPDVSALVNMLMQTERFGTPIAKALATFAEGVRLKRSQAAEEVAAKSTIKIIFPLVFFIFPAIFIVLLGPVALHIMHAISSQQ